MVHVVSIEEVTMRLGEGEFHEKDVNGAGEVVFLDCVLKKVLATPLSLSLYLLGSISFTYMSQYTFLSKSKAYPFSTSFANIIVC